MRIHWPYEHNRTVLDGINIVAGLALVLSPWFLGYTAETNAAWNAWLTGGAIVLIAVGALVAFYEAEEWANLVLGFWTILAPWALGFSGLGPAMNVHVIVGAVVAIVAAGGLWFTKHRPWSSA
jgi:hypothetical protein